MPDFAAEVRRRLAAGSILPVREIEIVEEITQHLEDRYTRSRAAGLTDDEALAAAWRELDASDALPVALVRVVPPAPAPPPFGWGVRMFPRDLLHAARTLAKARTYTVVCATSLGVGIGTVMAILILIRTFFGTPYGVNPDGLVEPIIVPTGQLLADARGPILDTWSYPDFVDVRDGARGVDIAGWAFGESMLRLPAGGDAAGGAVPVATMFVSSNYFSTVGVTLVSGRGLQPADDEIGAQPVAVLGHRLWETRFGSDPAIVGRTITLNQVAHVVVGIAPSRYQLHFSMDGAPDVQLWVPVLRHPRVQEASDVRFNRQLDWVRLLGRLAPDTTVEQADA